MKNDAQLQQDVQNAIKWEPLLNAATIDVRAKEGIVSLTGVVDSYAKKVEAENAAKKVIGVKAVVDHIEIKFPATWSKHNTEIEKDVLAALNASFSIPKDKVSVKVADAWVTLEGELPWNYQKEAAKNVVNYIAGVKGVVNNIRIKSESLDALEKNDIEAAIGRSGAIDGADINVSVSGTTVTLSGRVNSWYQKEEAARVVWKTAGIGDVNNELVVEHY